MGDFRDEKVCNCKVDSTGNGPDIFEDSMINFQSSMSSVYLNFFKFRIIFKNLILIEKSIETFNFKFVKIQNDFKMVFDF